MNYRLGVIKKTKVLSLESALASCAQVGDERSKAFLYKRYYGYVAAVVRRYVKNDFDLEELVNETFVKAFSSINRFNRLGEEDALDKSFRAWLARIAANKSIDLLRAQKPTLNLDEVGEYEVQPVMVNVQDDLYAEDILKLLEMLPEIQRLIFNMFEIEGYSHEEIGKALQIPDSTSRTYLTRAKQKLRKYYLETFVQKTS
ncbi:RNA polymerase sigma factor [Olivibacter sitiensis]|uniref:RNA polymerase sigma factor n=1 Tax=Olivibacter sitiensis TaxID=376470 RepID=UPI000419BD4A|nr:sigma-70 family RNA polymerase sigma factor [Olivibacter sitiensis]